MELHESLNILDSSKLSDYMQCPRYFFYRHVLGWRHEGPQFDLIFGEAMHAALETLYKFGFHKDAQYLAYANFLDVYRVYYPEETDDDMGAKSPYSASEAIEGYCNYYQREFDRYDVLEYEGEKCVEVSGFALITNASKLYFRQDVIMRDRTTGQVFTLEHKTAGRGGATWAAQWDLSVQIGTYTHALYSIFPPEEVWGVRVNGIIFLKKEQKFERVPCEKTYEQMQAWHMMVKTWLGLMTIDLHSVVCDKETESDVMSHFPLNPGSCTKWNRVCQFHDFCTSWPNPLQRCDEVPLGFVQEFWDPQLRREKLSNAE